MNKKRNVKFNKVFKLIVEYRMMKYENKMRQQLSEFVQNRKNKNLVLEWVDLVN